ncbi:MAG: hypothetical protein ACTSQ8_10165 [Candidatus Helarchaeota archaeon]
MKSLVHKWCAGIFLILALILPNFLFIPSIAATHTIYDNYDSDTSTGVINVYYQSPLAFQSVQEVLDLTNSSIHLIVGTQFYYSSDADSELVISAIDNSSGLTVSSQNLTAPDTNNVKTLYTHYFLENSYLLSRGSHMIRFNGLNATPIGIHYTILENGFSYYCNETTTAGNYSLDSKQYFIQFMEESIINLTSLENQTGLIDFPTLHDAVDGYLLYLPANPVKIILNVKTPGENLNLELYNYTNNGDIVLTNATVKTYGVSNTKIITYIPTTPNYYVLLVKPFDPNADISNYTVSWVNSSNQIEVTPPVVNFENSTMTLDISGIYANMDGFYYNGTSYPPESTEYAIYREIDDLDMGKNGTVTDLDGNGEWISTGINVAGLNPGGYYVRAVFKDNDGNAIGISPKSNRFFVLGNLSVGAANIIYINEMTQKINITGITVDNTTSLDIYTYTIYDYDLKANTSLSGILTYDSNTLSWNATNIDVSSLSEGLYFVLGYFEDHSEHLYGIGNTTSVTLDLFTITHIIEVNQIFINYTNEWVQDINIGGLASTSFQGNGIGNLIQENESIVTCQIFNSQAIYTGLSGNLSWTGISWNTTINVANLTEGVYYAQILFSNVSSSYNASALLNSSYFSVDHIINITALSQFYVDDTSQIVSVMVSANTSYQGNSGVAIEANPNVKALGIIVNASNSELTPVSALASWDATSSSWIANISTASLPEGDYCVMMNFSVISNEYNASAVLNTTSFTISHVLTLTVPMPTFYPDNATVDILGIIATDSYTGYHHINDTTVQSTYFEMFNFTSKESLGIYGALTYNPTFDDWRNTSIDLSTYPEGLYYIYVNITSIDVPEGVVQNSSPFELVHKIIISDVSIDYTDGFQQVLNITVKNAISTYQGHSFANISHHNYRFYFQENRTTVLHPDLSGNLTWSGTAWTALANVSKLPVGEYYVVVNFADPTATNSKGSAETTNFTVIHTINVSVPTISYINSMDQMINVSCYANSSYYYHRNMNSSNYGSGYYRIHLSNGIPTTITGDLHWNGESWVATNVDVSMLPIGMYSIICHLSTYYDVANSSFSSTFTITHILQITQPVVRFDNSSKLLNLTQISVLSSFSTYGYLTDLTAQTASFEIFTVANQSTGISGSLTWNGSEWQLINFAIPSLQEGSYYVKVYFNDSQTSLTAKYSDIFVAEYPKEELDWIIITIIILVALAAVIVLFWTFFTEIPPEEGKEA